MDGNRYQEIRQEMQQVFQKAFDWNRLSSEQIIGAATRLGVWHKNQLCYKEDEDKMIFFEYCFYESLTAKGSQIGQYREESGLTLASLMEQSIHSLYEVVGCSRETNEVHLKDLIHADREELSLVDINLSHSNAIGLIIYTRLIPFDNNYISTGVTMTFSKENSHSALVQKSKIELKKRRKLSSQEQYQWAYLSYIKYSRS
ncbi:hypothetical protein K5X82_17980 [Halosquirtibacter xylanolyticus]|uniref:hypothetical protein n=1 Tax=Halosquirtibacter xylanolyticus TaxID=3374599 RepID=UPI003747F317|nr:hypothetical protein K5X82_17980 [Prolixibacteraceae bacterium]